MNEITTAAQAAQHQDDAAVDAMAAAMKAKLAKQRAKGYGGWDTDCTQERLTELLRAHVDKGDPVDVANFCAFLFARNKRIAAAPQAVQPHVAVVWVGADGVNDFELVPSFNLPKGEYRLYAGAPPVPHALEQEVREIVGLLNNKEWAEHIAQTALGRELESAITALYNRATPPAAQGLDAQNCDMFWVADDPDGQHDTLHDAVVRAFEDGGIDADGCVEIQCAKSIPNIVVRITGVKPFAFKVIPDSELAAQAKQGA